MKTVRRSILSAFVLALSIASGAWAVDEGQTKPRLNSNGVNTNTTVDVIPLTSGSGNIKGFQCSENSGFPLTTWLHFYVDGGAAQTLDPEQVLFNISSDGTYQWSDMVPMNIRFASSIRVTLQKSFGTGNIWCAVSWGLD
jgi:hypothetical protein